MIQSTTVNSNELPKPFVNWDYVKNNRGVYQVYYDNEYNCFVVSDRTCAQGDFVIGFQNGHMFPLSIKDDDSNLWCKGQFRLLTTDEEFMFKASNK